MGIENNENENPAQKEKRLRLGTAQAARKTLSKLINDRYNKKTDSQTFRDLVYGISKMLEQDKHLLDIETNKRLETIEKQLSGAGSTVIEPALIGNQYAQSLKQQLENEQRKNIDLQTELLAMKRQIAEIQANS